MRYLIIMTLLLNSCSTYHPRAPYQRGIAAIKTQNSPTFELKLSSDLLFANGANSVALQVIIKNAEINPNDLKLISDISVESGKFSLVNGAYTVTIKPKVKSPNIKLMVIWKDQTSPMIELKTTLAPLMDKMLPQTSTSSTMLWVSDLYYQRQDYLPEGQFEAFQVENRGKNPIVSAEDSLRSFDFDFEEQARQNISMMVADAPNGTVSHTMQSLFTFFPRKYLPFAEVKNKQVTVTLPTGEKMIFGASGEIIGGVFTEGPVDIGPDRFKRSYADLKYQGKGIVMRANARGQMPQQGQFESTQIDMEYGLKYSSDVLIINGTTGQRCRRPKIDFWLSADVSPILFKFPTDKEFDTYLRAKCNFGIPDLDEKPAAPESENISEIASDLWNKCENDSDIKECLSQETENIENEITRSKVKFELEQLFLKAKEKEQGAIPAVLQKEVTAIRVVLLSEASWMSKQSCLDKSQALVQGSFKFHDIQQLIQPQLVQNCSSIKEEMDKIATAEVTGYKEKLEASFDWASVSTNERLIADCQKKALTFISSENRYNQTPAIYIPALKSICATIDSSPAFTEWIKSQSAGLEDKVYAQLLIDVEARGEKQAISCVKQYPVDTQLNRMRFKKLRDGCLVDNWFALEAEAIKVAKQDPLVQRVNLSFDNINTRIAMERRRLQLKLMKNYFL